MAAPGYGQPDTPASNNTLGVVSLVLGIVSIPAVCCFYIGVPLGVGAIVLGFLGKQRADRGQATNRSQAVAGLLCGAAALAIAILLAILSLVFRSNELPGLPRG